MRYTIGEMAEIIDGDRGKNYPHQHEFLDEGYCLFLNTGNVTKAGFSFDSNQFISKEKCDLLRKGKLQRHDIVYTTRGTVGNAAYYSDSIPYEHVADLIDEQLGEQIRGKATISRDIRDVEYHESFKRFMQSIEQHDYVITVISDSYFKSRNCMYEVLEVVKDSRFSDKLVFIVLRDEDCQYYKTPKANGIAANVYSTEGQTSYSIFWKHQENELQKQIDELGDPTYAITQIKEKKVIQKILLDLPEFIEFVRDSKGLSLTEHIAHNFSDIIKFMNL